MSQISETNITYHNGNKGTCVERITIGSLKKNKTEWAFVSSTEIKVINRIRELAAQFPETYIILNDSDYENSIYAKFPWNMFPTLKAPRDKRILTDEQKEALRERMKLARSKSEKFKNRMTDTEDDAEDDAEDDEDAS